MFEFGVSVRLGIMSRVYVCAVLSAAFAVVLFFVSVNQVLLRLWTRVIGINPFGLVEVPLFGRLSDWVSCSRLNVLHSSQNGAPLGRTASGQRRCDGSN
jgi:hypothetical protein